MKEQAIEVERTRRELKASITGYGADCAGHGKSGGRDCTLAGALQAADDYAQAKVKQLSELIKTSYPCQRCGRRDGLDAAVTDEQWAAISGRTDGGGLLCLWCMDELAAEEGLEHVPVRLYFAGLVLFSVPLDEFTDLEWSEAQEE